MTIAADFATLSKMLLEASILAKKLQLSIESGAAMAMAEGATTTYPAPQAKYVLYGARKTLAELAALAGCSASAMQQRITTNKMSPEDAVAAGATQQYLGSHWLNGERRTARQLADLAGCSYEAMKGRLKRMSPEAAVQAGAEMPIGRVVRSAPRVEPPPPPPPPPPPSQPQRSVFEPRAAVPEPITHGRRVSTATVPPTPAPAPKPAAEEPTVPPDVKRTFWQPPVAAPVPSTFGRIGDYEETGSAIERAVKERGR